MTTYKVDHLMNDDDIQSQSPDESDHLARGSKRQTNHSRCDRDTPGVELSSGTRKYQWPANGSCGSKHGPHSMLRLHVQLLTENTNGPQMAPAVANTVRTVCYDVMTSYSPNAMRFEKNIYTDHLSGAEEVCTPSA